MSVKTTQSFVYEGGWKPITKIYDEACWAMVKGMATLLLISEGLENFVDLVDFRRGGGLN